MIKTANVISLIFWPSAFGKRQEAHQFLEPQTGFRPSESWQAHARKRNNFELGRALGEYARSAQIRAGVC